jgi:hypothetical protein
LSGSALDVFAPGVIETYVIVPTHAVAPSTDAVYRRSKDFVPIRRGATSMSIHWSNRADADHSSVAFTSMTSNSDTQNSGPKPSDSMKRVHASSKYVSQCALKTTP